MAMVAWLLASPSASVSAAEPEIEAPQLLHRETPIYPIALKDSGKKAVVLLELDIDVSGKVGKIAIVESAGAEFDGAATTAAKLLVFSPARAAGKAVAVRIRFRYEIAPEIVIDRRELGQSLGRFDRRDLEESPLGFHSLTGQVLERGTGRPVIGALVTLVGIGGETVTDAEGHFRFGQLKPGKIQIYLPGAEHKAVRQDVVIVANATVTVKLLAERLSYNVYKATAEAPPEPGEMTRRSISVEEIQKIPGGNGDGFKVVQNLPSVSRATAGSGQIIVRGSAPGDTIINIEGVKIPILYHFGGVYSIINTDILQGIDFSPGGYSVKYGRQTGGLLTARLAVPATGETWHGYVESNVFHTGFLLKGPVGEKTNLVFAARRSYIDAVLATVVPAGTLPFTLSPRYYDYQVKIDHRFDLHTNLTVLLFGTNDSLTALLPNPPAAFPQAHGDIASTTSFSSLLGVLRHDGDHWRSTTTIGAVLGAANASFAELFRFDVSSREYTLRQDFSIGGGPVQLRTGLDILCNPFSIEVYAPPLRATGERGQFTGQPPDLKQIFAKQSGVFVSPAAYFDTVLKLHPKWEIVPGIRLDLYRVDSQGQSFTPRLNLRYKLSDGVVLKAATGQSSQRPEPQYLGNNFGNPNLLPFRSFETAVGFEYKISEAIDVDMQAFHKQLEGLVVTGPGIIPSPSFVNNGTGNINGVEFFLRHKPIGNFFGWLSYTLQKATRIDTPGGPERPFGWDQTNIITAIGSYKLPLNFEAGLRFRYVTGNPTTDVVTAVWNEQSDTYTRVPSACNNCARLPAFHQLDVRVDKKFVFDSWLLNLYIDVQNVYNHGNAEGVQYNFDATLKQYQTGLPIIPSLGIRGEF